MIIMLVGNDPTLKKRFQSFFTPLGYSVIQYSRPLKAMDNMDEVAPQILVCCTSDYPRHWKLIIKQLRESRTRDESVAILAVPKDFPAEEANKAAFLGVNILYPERMETLEDFQELNVRISRYVTPPERPQFNTWIPGKEDKVSFIFRHPEEYRMVSGRFTELNPAGGVFRPDDPADIQELKTGTIIENGSLKAGDSLLSLNARIIRNSGTLSLAFVEFSDDGFQDLLEEMNMHVSTI